MILGIDVGYSMTKVYSKQSTDIFMSTVEDGINDVNKASLTIEYEGKQYTIGEKTGAFSTEMNKINDPVFRLCLFTAIARAMKDETVTEVKLVTGLPAEYYKTQKQELINSLEGLSVTMVYKDKPKKFLITRVIVFPQSAGLFILQPTKFEGDNIIIDIGGLTVDVSYFNDLTLSKTRTYELGMLKLYDKIVQEIKAAHQVSYDPLKAENIIRNKTIIKDGETIDVANEVNAVMRKHMEEIIMNVKNGLSEYTTSKRSFIGGGSYMLRDFLPGNINHDDIYTNAKAFYLVGVEKFAS